MLLTQQIKWKTQQRTVRVLYHANMLYLKMRHANWLLVAKVKDVSLVIFSKDIHSKNISKNKTQKKQTTVTKKRK